MGALLGAAWLGEPLSIFTVAGGALVILGLSVALTGRLTPLGGGPRRRRASAKMASNIVHVSLPVCVFWRLGW